MDSLRLFKMTNIHISWVALRDKSVAESLGLHYAERGNRYQVYLLDGPDAHITYIPVQRTINDPNFVAANSSQEQSDLDDFEDNYKSGATQDDGVSD